MSKFKKKKGGELPPVVLRKDNLLVENSLPPANQIEKLDKTKTVFIYIGRPKPEYRRTRGTEAIVQIGDKYVSLEEVRSAIFEEIVENIRPELHDYVTVALKVDEDANSGVVNDVKQILRKANLPKIIYITPNSESAEI